MEKEFKLPVNLHREARKYMKVWLNSLRDRGIEIQAIHHGIYNLIAWTWHDFFRAKDMVKKEGEVVRETTARGNRVTKPHPALKIMTDSKNQVRLLMAELQLTPKSTDPKNIQGDLFNSLPSKLQKFKPKKPGVDDMI